jgi:hypothetical protein
MTYSRPRANFNRSGLIHALAGLSGVDVDAPNQSLAERLGPWLDVADAIALFAALNSGPRREHGEPAREPSAQGALLREDLARTRAALANSIGAGELAKLGDKARVQSAPRTSAVLLGIVVEFVPYRRYYLARQRTMASSIGQLRARARAALATCTPELKQLAELDAVMDQALAGRESDLLMTVPGFLEQRFEALRQAHLQALAEAQRADDPDSWLQPGGWLAKFHKDLQDVLRAELELRLQPVVGLIETYSNQVSSHQ